MMLPGAGRVQVDESGAAGRVAHAFHQLTRVGTCFSDELITGMAQVVQVNAETGCGECATPNAAAEVGVPQWHAVWAGENQRIGLWLGEGVEVRADVGRDQGWYRHGALACVGLGRGEERLAASYLAELAGDADGPAVAIDVGALESGQFTPPQTAETGKEYRAPCIAGRSHRPGRRPG